MPSVFIRSLGVVSSLFQSSSSCNLKPRTIEVSSGIIEGIDDAAPQNKYPDKIEINTLVSAAVCGKLSRCPSKIGKEVTDFSHIKPLQFNSHHAISTLHFTYPQKSQECQMISFCTTENVGSQCAICRKQF